MLCRVMYLPPMRCRPSKCLPSGFGAVIFISSIEMKELPSLYAGGPPSISQDDGVSTLVTGNLVS